MSGRWIADPAGGERERGRCREEKRESVRLGMSLSAFRIGQAKQTGIKLFGQLHSDQSKSNKILNKMHIFYIKKEN